MKTQNLNSLTLRKGSKGTRIPSASLRKMMVMLLCLLTLSVGQAWSATIPANTVIYLDVTNFKSDQYNNGYYMSVTASANSSYSATKDDTSGAGSYKPKSDNGWTQMTQVSGNIYKATVTSQSTTGKVSFWSQNENNYDNVWQVNVSLAQTYDGTNDLFTISSGYTSHTDRQTNCFSGTWSKYSSGSGSGSSCSSSEVWTVAGVEELMGSYWNDSDSNNDMTYEGDCVWKLTKTAVELTSGDKEFKICKDHAWDTSYGDNGGNNNKINIPSAGTYDITFTFNASTHDNSASATVSTTETVQKYYIAGNGSGNWLGGLAWTVNANQLTDQADIESPVITRTFTSCPAQNNEFKITDGQWNSGDDNGHEYDYSNIDQTNSNVTLYGEGTSNISFRTLTTSTIVIGFNTSTKKITVNVTPTGDYKTIYVRNNMDWSAMYIYTWDAKLHGDWPGQTGETNYAPEHTYSHGGYSNITNSQWWTVTIYPYTQNFIINNGKETNASDKYQTGNKAYNDITDGHCYELASTNSTNMSFTDLNTVYPDKPTVTTDAASTIENTQATLQMDVTINHDKVTDYGFYILQSDEYSRTVEQVIAGTKQAISGSLNTDANDKTKTVTGLTPGKKYFFVAYATNGFGTSYGTVQSFTTPGLFTVSVGINTRVGHATMGSVDKTSLSAGVSIASESVTATEQTGYRFVNWTATDGITITSPNVKATQAGTLTANFEPQTYTVTLNQNGATTAGTTSVTATYYEGLDNITSMPSRTGYTFTGYWTGEGGTGTKVINTDGSWVSAVGETTSADDPRHWIKADDATFYAGWDAQTYTVTFDATKNGGYMDGSTTKEVRYDAAYGELPVATPPSAKQFVGWYTTASDAGTRVTAETIVSTDANHTIYARYESTYTVTITYKCGADEIYPESSTTASATSLAATITAPDVLGYQFSNWTGTNATFGDASSASTTVNASAATTITANYTAVPMVYFKNNLGWEDVYVTFDAAFADHDGKQVPSNNGKPYYKMTQMGNTDVFYCVIPDTYTNDSYDKWAWNIAFDNKGMGYNETTHTGSYEKFYQGEFTGRGDFDPNQTMYIPYNGDTETRNSGTYYKTGCWIKYNSTLSGYQITANTYVSGSGGSAVSGTPVDLTANVAGGYEFKATVNFPNSNYGYGFMVYKDALKNTNDKWYTNTGAITSSTTSLPWDFTANGAEEDGTRCKITTEATGEYVFTVSFATGRPMVNVEYPVSAGDWRLVYKDLTTWSNAAHTANWYHPSRVVKKAANATDTLSFYVSKADGANATIELQKCESIVGGNPNWVKQGNNLDLSNITATGVYNFIITQDGSMHATAAYDGVYEGDFYIRTDASDGGWSNYKTSGANTMTYSEYSITNGGYSHYFMRHENAGKNIKFCIANDYSQCITDSLVNDNYSGEYLAAEGNIRFMWNQSTNKISRAYLSGSAFAVDRFLVLEGDNMIYDEDGEALHIDGLNAHEISFTDDQNWVYETTIQANPLARVKLTAKYNDHIQYFYGAEGTFSDATTYQLIGGSGSNKYKIRVVYDFKTNRLVTAWLPSGDIDQPMALDADVMIIRYHQDDAQQITFSGTGNLTEVKTVYGAMQFNKYRLNNQSETGGHGNLGLSQYARDLFFISFPFDVKLNDVFGFGTYGKHWIIEYYDGKGRAQNGFWADSPTNWKFVTKQMKDNFTLKANEGYVLALELSELDMSSSVWNNGVENVYLYFPSTASVENIQATSKDVAIDQDGYRCTINRPYGNDGDRRIKDSFWHLLGVPSYANATHATGSALTDGWPTTNDPDAWTTTAPYIYAWIPQTNEVTVQSSASMTFKPMYSYLAQYSGETIHWESINATPATVAARRIEGYKGLYELRLDLKQDEQEIDHTYISLREDEAVTTNFDFDYDLCKTMYGAFSSNNSIYTITNDAIEVAGNCLPLTEQTTIVPVGVSVAANGMYTLSLPEGTDGLEVMLVDNEAGTRTDLGLLDQEIYLTKGSTNRFMLEIQVKKGAPTDIELITESSEKSDRKDSNAHKFLRNGVMYILHNGMIYDAQGNRVK